jgi:hypothetical protein
LTDFRVESRARSLRVSKGAMRTREGVEVVGVIDYYNTYLSYGHPDANLFFGILAEGFFFNNHG